MKMQRNTCGQYPAYPILRSSDLGAIIQRTTCSARLVCAQMCYGCLHCRILSLALEWGIPVSYSRIQPDVFSLMSSAYCLQPDCLQFDCLQPDIIEVVFHLDRLCLPFFLSFFLPQAYLLAGYRFPSFERVQRWQYKLVVLSTWNPIIVTPITKAGTLQCHCG
jgi:hypothetical protein